MNCSRVRKFLPLYAGADLSAGKSRRLEKHLEGCADCRRVLEELRTALDGIRAVAGREALDWPEAEWRSLMARVKSEKPEPRQARPPAGFPRKAWAYGFVIVLVLGIAALILKAILSSPTPSLLSETVTVTAAQPSRALMTDPSATVLNPQDVPFKMRREKGELDRTVLAAGRSPEKTRQDLMSVILVSQETGLKVYWTFNRNFEWEEKKQ